MKRVTTPAFLFEGRGLPIVDVRSPGEFAEGHIVGAVNIPVFDDEERARVGTTYTKVGPAEAIELGLSLVGPRMLEMAKKAQAVAHQRQLKVHCWRGGMRSEKMAWLFELVGLEVTVLEGGYKAYRQQMLTDFARLDRLIVLYGPTGCGKTDILAALQAQGEQVLDLEGRAHHRGSAFGALGMPAQPTTAQFQNQLYADLLALDPARRIWIESESFAIGKVCVPQSLWNNMSRTTVVELDVPKAARAQRIVREYGAMPKAALAESIQKIQSRFGGNRVKDALELLALDQLEAVTLLLLDYYDGAYAFSKNKYKNGISARYDAATDDPAATARHLIQLANQLTL